MSSKNATSLKSMGRTMVLVVFGVGAICGGVAWLAVLIPAAIFVWYGATPIMRNGRN